MKKDRLYEILESMKKNQLKAELSHFGALSDHSAAMHPKGMNVNQRYAQCVFERMHFNQELTCKGPAILESCF